MFFSKYILDVNNSSVLEGLMDEYEMHRNVQSLFNTSREESKVLYNRVDNCLYVYSAIKPLLEHEGFRLIGSKEVNIKFNIGQQFMFNAKVYPSKKEARKDKKNSVRVPIRGNKNKIQWMYDTAEKHGFKIISTNLQNESEVLFTKNGCTTTIIPCTFTGLLIVTDPELFYNTYNNGIGAEKAFGMGMIMIAPKY